MSNTIKIIETQGIPNLNKIIKFEFILKTTNELKFEEIVLKTDTISENIKFIDLINIDTNKGFRLTKFETIIPKGKYQCVIQSNIQSDKRNETIVLKTKSNTGNMTTITTVKNYKDFVGK